MIILRFLKLLFLTAWYAAGFAVRGLGKAGEERRRLRGHWLRSYLIRMGPLYIKMGQIMATRSDVLSEELISDLRPLQDDVPPMEDRHVDRALERAYRQPRRAIFSEFSREPLASASIAQVHAAVLPDGEPVAVKIVKRNVGRHLEQNLALVAALVRVVHRLLPRLRRFHLPERFAELEALLLPQVDMLREAQQQAAIHANFQGHPYVRIPRVHESLCTRDVLVTERMHGIPGKDVRRVDHPAPELARRLQDAVFTMIYMHGLAHADAHPGNIWFTNDGKVIFLDFGIIAELNEDEKWALSSFYYACTRREWGVAAERYARHLVTDTAGIYREWERYLRLMRDCLRLHFEAKTRWSSLDFFHDVNEVLQQFGAHSNANLMKVELAFMSVEGFATQIDTDIDVWANARRFNDRYSPYMSAGVKKTFDLLFARMTPRSLELREKAGGFLVAPLHLDRYFFPSAYPLFVSKVYGSKIEDIDGNVYIDLSCGYGPHILGFAHPAVAAALGEALTRGCVNALANTAELQLAEALVEAFPAADKVLLCNSGTEAAIQAIRLCRSFTRRSRVAKFEGQYHGFSDQGLVSSWFRCSGPLARPEPIAGAQGCDPRTVRGTLVLQYGHAGSLQRLREHAGELACVVCEPMPAALAEYDEDFLAELREICTETGVPLVFDEVVSGFRVAYGGVQTLTGVEPDLTCLGKIIGGGLPCGAVIGRSHLIEMAKSTDDPFLDYDSRTFVGGTLSGNSLSCAAGHAALAYLKDHPQIYVDLESHTDWLARALREVAAKRSLALQVSAKASIFSLTFDHRATRYYREKFTGSNMKANIALAYYMREHRVYMPELHTLMLNAAHTPEDLQAVVAAFDNSLSRMVDDGFFAL